MIDRDARARVARELRLVVAGLMPLPVFDRSARDLSASTQDASLREVIGFCLRNFDLGDPWLDPSKQSGKISPSSRRMFARVVLWLRSDETAFAKIPYIPLGAGAGGIASGVLLATFFAASVMLLSDGKGSLLLCGVAGAFVVAWFWWLARRETEQSAKAQEYLESDYCWPFISRRAFARANRRPLLGAAA